MRTARLSCLNSVPAGAELDDVVQEVMTRLVAAVDRYDPKRGKWSTFVSAIARRCMADRMRKLRGRTGKRPQMVTNFGWRNKGGHGDEIGGTWVSSFDFKTLMESRNPARPYKLSAGWSRGLSEKQIEAIALVYGPGRGHRKIHETAAMMGLNYSTCKSILQRARARIRENLMEAA